MVYNRLGTMQVKGQSDGLYQVNQYGLGVNWDVVVDASTAKQSPPTVSGQWPLLTAFECYHIYLDGPVGSSFSVLINRQPWDSDLQGWQNGWDPSEPMLLSTEDQVAFCWSVPFTSPPYTPSGGSNVQPVVTMWLREQA